MEFWTRGYYPATRHRVPNATLPAERLSIMSFFLPDLRCQVSPIEITDDSPLANAELSLSSDNSWLTRDRHGNNAAEAVPIVIGEKEWERVNAIFPE
jgi:isopenicillin N synthase-like dioxygenase